MPADLGMDSAREVYGAGVSLLLGAEAMGLDGVVFGCSARTGNGVGDNDLALSLAEAWQP